MSCYLDYNATAPVRPQVRDAMSRALTLEGNPSSVHGAGRRARAAVEEARERVAALAGTSAANVVFTGSGSEANNLALAGPRPAHILVSAIEHPSILRPAAERPGGFGLIPVDRDGVVDLAALEAQIAEIEAAPLLVSVMLANNETGVLQPSAEVVAIAKAAGALVHVDAVQAAGRVPLDFDRSGADLMSLSAHKLGGPKGVGALIKRAELDLAPLISGGGQERSLRAGTENVPGIVGFGAAAAAAAEELAGGGEIERQRQLRDRLEEAVGSLGARAVVVGGAVPRLANTSCLAFPGYLAETLVIAFDLEGIAVSAGSACSSGKVEASHVLEAMDLAPDIATSAIRVSLGYGSSDADVDAFLAAAAAILSRAPVTAAGSVP
ncbi:MAG: cysteine desulfurase family protein [Alphaproteobacteria bacterium]|nr:cysteine desulfurase family protein [Alphaproteobacteria bacterium]